MVFQGVNVLFLFLVSSFNCLLFIPSCWLMLWWSECTDGLLRRCEAFIWNHIIVYFESL